MEHLWSPAGATGGNQPQIGPSRKRLNRADWQPVATHGNRFGAHGKEGVDGSSPSEGLKYLQIASFCCLIRRAGSDAYRGGQRRRHLQGLLVALAPRAAVRGTVREHSSLFDPISAVKRDITRSGSVASAIPLAGKIEAPDERMVPLAKRNNLGADLRAARSRRRARSA